MALAKLKSCRWVLFEITQSPWESIGLIQTLCTQYACAGYSGVYLHVGQWPFDEFTEQDGSVTARP